MIRSRPAQVARRDPLHIGSTEGLLDGYFELTGLIGAVCGLDGDGGSTFLAAGVDVQVIAVQAAI